MIVKVKGFLKKYFLFLYYIFIVVFYLFTKEPGKSFDGNAVVYSIIIFVPFVIMSLVKVSPIKFFGLSLDKLKGKLLLWVLPFFLLNNFFFFFFYKTLLGEDFTVRSITLFLILKYFFSTVHIRTFGEEFVFRGFLLSDKIKNNPKRFWIANFSQSLIFTSLHAIAPLPIIHRIIVVIFIFCLSLLWGVLNRKFNSLFPSWIIHSTGSVLRHFI